MLIIVTVLLVSIVTASSFLVGANDRSIISEEEKARIDAKIADYEKRQWELMSNPLPEDASEEDILKRQKLNDELQKIQDELYIEVIESGYSEAREKSSEYRYEYLKNGLYVLRENIYTYASDTSISEEEKARRYKILDTQIALMEELIAKFDVNRTYTDEEWRKIDDECVAIMQMHLK
jgi:hypothetical protein